VSVCPGEQQKIVDSVVRFHTAVLPTPERLFDLMTERRPPSTRFRTQLKLS
jgi:hypothetical protein